MTAAPIATNPLTLNGYLLTIGNLAIVDMQTVGGIVSSVDPNFNAMVPQMLNYAELRIQRDLDLLPLETIRGGYTMTVGNNMLEVPVSDFVTVQSITIRGGSLADAISLAPVSKEWLQMVYNTSAPALQGPPKYFAPYGGDSNGGDTFQYFRVGPFPDAAYDVNISGTIRAPSLYKNAGTPAAATNTTFISTYLPDLLIMASMIFVSGYQRNFSATSDDPNMAANYEKQYQTLMKGAMGEELRKRFRASAWSSNASSPAATPNRT